MALKCVIMAWGEPKVVANLLSVTYSEILHEKIIDIIGWISIPACCVIEPKDQGFEMDMFILL